MARKKTYKHLVEVYRDPAKVGNNGAPSGKCSSCGARSSCSEVEVTVEQWMTDTAAKYGDDIRIRTVDSKTKASVGKRVEVINKLLEAKREDIRVSEDSFLAFMSKWTPLIVIDGVLFFMGSIPSNQQMERAFEIMTKASV
ncbi:MAG: hypothetical protein SVY53_08255 [Chloroflexota bacterium]|nr:hypothetical protein [Chloroflexota bacterium]